MSAEVDDIISKANSLAESAIAEIGNATDLKQLDAVRVKFLGKKGDISLLMKELKNVPPENRRDVGQAINTAKNSAEDALSAKKQELEQTGGSSNKENQLDVTLPGIRSILGRRHPIMTTLEEIKSILVGLGFHYEDYPEVETEYFNFDSLNTPDWHPARDSHDTFYTESGRLLRTHTTAFQNHAMKQLGPPPLRAMTAGRCYRCDTIDASHYPIFHQLDAIAIGKSISFADLKWTLYELARALFGDDVQLRFRPSYFPFTTPSAEVDVLFQSKWLEILGSGMMHPNVLRNGGLDPEEWQGFAFGLGVDRMAMIRHGIDDIRYLYDNEELFLRQF